VLRGAGVWVLSYKDLREIFKKGMKSNES